MPHKPTPASSDLFSAAVAPVPLLACFFYRQHLERNRQLRRCLQEALQHKRQFVLIAPGPVQRGVRDGLAAPGTDLEALELRGELRFATPEGLGLLTTEPVDAAADCLAALVRSASARGFAGLSVYWEMAGAILEKDLLWFRACLGKGSAAFSAGSLGILCGFDRTQVSSRLLLSLLPLYPYICHEDWNLPNPYAFDGAAGWEGDQAARESNGTRHEKQSRRPHCRQQILDAIMADAPIGLWVLDKEHRMVFTNQNFCRATGIDEGQFLRAPHYSRVMEPGDAIDCMLSDARAFAADGPVEAEETIRSPDGRPHIYRVVKTRLVDERSKFEGLLGVAVDITKQKVVEQRLRYREARFRDVALSIAGFIWEIDRQGSFTYCSNKIEKMLGFAVADIVGRCCFELFPETEGQRLERLFAGAARFRKGFRNLQTWVLDARGRRRWLRISGLPILDREGACQGFRGITEDITARKQAEADMQRALARAERARYQVDNIINSTADGLIVTGPVRHRILVMNDAAREWLATDGSNPIGLLLAELLPGSAVQQQVQAVYSAQKPAFLQTDFPLQGTWTGGERRRILQARTSLMRNKQGRVSGAITTLRDVTGERELDRMKAEFMSMAAHELRTPLTAILGYAELCMNPQEFGGFSAEQQKEFIGEIYQKAEELARRVNELLDISRLETGRPLSLDKETVSLAHLLIRQLERFRLRAPQHRFEITLTEDFPVAVTADRSKLEQVLENLLDNAVKFSPAGSLISLHGKRAGAWCQVALVDRGIGMTSDQSERVFDNFYRADASNTAVKGLGIGTSIAKRIVEQHGGSIWLKSTPGVGTRVVFTLPLDAQEQEFSASGNK